VGTSHPPRARAARKAARRSDAPPRKTTRKAAGKTARTAPRPENLSEIRIQVTTIGDLLLTAADRHPDAEALVFPDFRMTYAQLAARALERARSLQALGVRPREHVGLLLPTCPEFVEFFFAIALCGAVAVPINARYKPHELGYVIENGDLVTIVTTAQIAEQVNFVMRLDGALPGLTAQKNALALELPSVPRLRNIVLLGKSAPTAFVPEKQLAALAKKVAVGVRAPQPARRARTRRRHDALHVRYDGEPERLPDLARGDGPQQHCARSLSLSADRAGPVLVAAADVPHRRDPAADRHVRCRRCLLDDELFRRGTCTRDARAREGDRDVPVVRNDHG
jgi:hypothetical protein